MLVRKWRYPLVGLAALVGCTGTPGQIDSPPPVPTPSGPPPAVQPGDCPDPANTPLTGGGFEIPEGASWARVCGTSTTGTGSDQGFGAEARKSPPDALVTNLDGLIAYANALPKMPSDAVCTMEFGPAYTLVFGYPDGSTTMVTGELYGCRPVGDRAGAGELLNDFGNRLRAQRDAYPQIAPAADSCAEPPEGFGDRFVQPAPHQTTAAYVVATPPDNYQRVVRQIEEWPALLDEMQRESRSPAPPASEPGDGTTSFGPAVEIDATNPQCEALTLQVSDKVAYWTDPTAGPMVWQLSDEALAILQPYLDWAAATIEPFQLPPMPDPAKVCAEAAGLTTARPFEPDVENWVVACFQANDDSLLGEVLPRGDRTQALRKLILNPEPKPLDPGPCDQLLDMLVVVATDGQLFPVRVACLGGYETVEGTGKVSPTESELIDVAAARARLVGR